MCLALLHPPHLPASTCVCLVINLPSGGGTGYHPLTLSTSGPLATLRIHTHKVLWYICCPDGGHCCITEVTVHLLVHTCIVHMYSGNINYKVQADAFMHVHYRGERLL